MAIEKGKDIAYSDVIENVKTFLKDICYNIDGWKKGVDKQGNPIELVPVRLRNGQTYTYQSKKFNQVLAPKGGVDSPYPNILVTEHTIGVRGTVNDNMAKIVTSSEVEDDLNRFLSERGINITDKVKNNLGNSEIISIKSVMNFYANIASFISARLVYVTNNLKDTVAILTKTTSTHTAEISEIKGSLRWQDLNLQANN